MAKELATTNPSTGKAVRLIDEWRADINRMESQFKMALPAHLPVERFMRVCVTALQNNPKLMACSKQSFFNAAVKCAQDGLLPDGREAAIVPFGEEDEDDGRGRTRADLAGYMPMVAGVRKKVRNSGEIKDWNAAVVYEGEPFEFELGDEPYIKHKKTRGGRVGRKIAWAYSVVTFKDGTKSRDVMPIEEIEDIRLKFSRSRKGPWSVPESYAEMCVKTVVKHHAKSLPMSTDLDRLIHRDDELYDFRGAADQREPVAPAPRPKSLASAFDVFAADEVPSEDHSGLANQSATNTESDRQDDSSREPSTTVGEAAGTSTATPPTAAPAASFVDPVQAAEQRGREDRAKGMSQKAVPPEWRTADKSAQANAWIKGWDAGG